MMYNHYRRPTLAERATGVIRDAGFWLMVMCGVIAIVAVVIVFFVWVVAMALALLGIAVIAWAAGVKFSVTKDGKPAGYIKRLTLYDNEGREVPWGSL